MTGTDLSLIADEMKKAQEILKKIHEMKNGVIGDKKIVMHTGVGTTVSTVSIKGNVYLDNRIKLFSALKTTSISNMQC